MNLEDVHVGYGAATTLNGISLEIAPGEVLGIAGRNGVGKTTLAKAIIGLLPTRKGAIQLDGARIESLKPTARAALGIGYVPQGRGIFDLSVEDNLRVGRRIGAHVAVETPEMNITDVHGMFPVLKRCAKRDARSLSGGEQQMLAIGRVLVGKPRLLILDEPSEGIQPSIVSEIGRIVSGLARKLNIGVLLIEQNVGLLTMCSDRICVIEKGNIIAEMKDVGEGSVEDVSRYLAL